MRTLVTIALVAVVGVHCGARPYSGETVASDEPTVAEEPTEPAPVVTAKSDDRSDVDPRWDTEVAGLPAPLFTTMVRGDDDELYAAGTFSGSLTLGGDKLTSRGADDIVLVRIEPSGTMAWVKSIGSTRAERAPKVTFAAGTLRLLAETEGEVDCGFGAMATWSSGMFFFCVFAADGTAMGGGTFPTGEP